MRPVHGGNLEWAATIAGCSASVILDFSASINPLGPPASALQAISNHLDLVRAYPDPDYHALKTALGQFHQLPPDWILPGNGSAELLTWAAWDLSKQVVTLLVTPAFSDYHRALRAFNAKLLEYPLPSLQPEGFDGSFPLANLPSQAAFATGILLNNPHNPTGLMWSRQALIPYLNYFDLVVVDEAFMDFLPPDQEQSLIPLVQEYPNLVILRSLTKFYSLPGLRLGYAISHPDRLQRWQARRDPWSVNILSAMAGIAVLQDHSFQQQTWDWLKVARDQLYQGLKRISGLQPILGAANFLLVQTQIPAPQLQETLLKEHQIYIRDCLSFPELGDRYFRIAVRTTAENQRLIEALKLIFD